MEEKSEKESYVSGNDGTKESYIHCRGPAVIAGRALFVGFSVVDSDTLTLLLGKGHMRKFRMNYDIGKGVLQMGRTKQLLTTSRAGHDANPILLGSWMSCVRAQLARGDFTVPRDVVDTLSTSAPADVGMEE